MGNASEEVLAPPLFPLLTMEWSEVMKLRQPSGTENDLIPATVFSGNRNLLLSGFIGIML